MGKITDTYEQYSSSESTSAEFEHRRSVHEPANIRVAELPLKITYNATATAGEQGMNRAEITAEMRFEYALELFAEIHRTTAQNRHLFLTENSFLENTLTKLGMQLVRKGDKDQPSLFRVSSDMFCELAEQDFRIEGLYHGKPFEIRAPDEDGELGLTPLKMTRNKDQKRETYTDSYTLQSKITAKPEKVKEHLTSFEKALQKWEETVKRKRRLKNSPGWLE